MIKEISFTFILSFLTISNLLCQKEFNYYINNRAVTDIGYLNVLVLSNDLEEPVDSIFGTTGKLTVLDFKQSNKKASFILKEAFFDYTTILYFHYDFSDKDNLVEKVVRIHSWQENYTIPFKSPTPDTSRYKFIPTSADLRKNFTLVDLNTIKLDVRTNNNKTGVEEYITLQFDLREKSNLLQRFKHQTPYLQINMN